MAENIMEAIDMNSSEAVTDTVRGRIDNFNIILHVRQFWQSASCIFPSVRCLYFEAGFSWGARCAGCRLAGMLWTSLFISATLAMHLLPGCIKFRVGFSMSQDEIKKPLG